MFPEKQKINARLKAETGSLFKQGGDRIVMLYPSPYRAGMSSLGYQWIISRLAKEGFSVERAFLPDDVEGWIKSRSPLISYETHTPISHFPVIGVSLAYELEIEGLIKALKLAGIPPLRKDRGPLDPKIILGGPITFSNPLPCSPFVDAMLLGEAEEEAAKAFRFAMNAADDYWKENIAKLPGGFVPDVHGVQLPKVAKATDEMLPARSHILSPDAELSNMFLIEGERGCHRMCTFCVMRRTTNGGMRLVTPEKILSFVPERAKRVGLVGAAISDHPKLPALLSEIVESGREVGVSSLRADRVARKPDIARLLRKGGYKTLTVASDAASERLRKVIAKGTKERDLIRCAELAAENRYKVMKVYMMLGVPDETDEDIDELIRFSLEMGKIHSIALGIAPFVPKRNTPLDASGFAGIKLVERRLKRLQKGLRPSKGKVQMRATSARWAWAEYMLAQGGPEHGLAVLNALEAGGRFSDWKKALNAVETDKKAPWRFRVA